MKLLPALLAALLALPAGASAATVKVPRSADRSCQGERADRAQRDVRFVPAADGLLTVTLRARRGDWDLALFDARSGRRHGASATFGAREKVIATVRAGRPVVAQACRLGGRARRGRVSFDLYETALSRGSYRARILRVPLLGAQALERLEATGADVTHNVTSLFADVVVYSRAERSRLAALGFAGTVVERRERATRRAAGLPSGREGYREYADYGEDLKALVDRHRGLVKAVEVGRSLEDRPIEGVEIAFGVDRDDDGRPVLAVLGLHHAREWPSGEMPMELAYDLAEGYGGTDEDITALLDRVRVLVLPMVNPDGFVVSRGAGEPEETYDDPDATLPLIVSDAGSYKRKNCRPAEPEGEAIPCALRTTQGVDLNRNYGAYWGGVGSSDNPAVQNYRGPGPYSEPESEAIHRLSQTRNIVTLISHHTFTDEGTWLRQPGFCTGDEPGCTDEDDVVPDEPGMKALGDAMGEATGWLSELGWKLSEITGATEDWNYFAAAAYGYTPEQRGANFHANHAETVVAEYDGTQEDAQGGVREALLRAAEQAADPTWHSVIEGEAPPGAVLRLHKAFQTPTSQEEVVIDDEIDLTLVVPEDGTYEWHVNPSTRPLSSDPEAYTLTCETPEGAVLETREVVVARGQRLTADLACGDTGGATPTPTVTATPTPTPTPAPRPGFTPASPRGVLRLYRPRMSTQRVNRRRAFSVSVRVDGSALKDFVLRFRSRKGKVLAEAARPYLAGDRRVRLRLRKRVRVRPGRYVLRAKGIDGAGRAITTKRRVRIFRRR